VHGFSLPDFGVRRDVAPGAPVEVTITPAKSGRFHYLCDNFCGEGHDRMGGLLVVT
jgi:cytochrome c oxidase subunit 2